MRKIPATMATQHPDNARAPYWEKDGDGFVSTYEEVEECYSSFRDLDCQEYMWDWEGKYVEEAVIERLFQGHYDYFKKHPLGKDKFLTFRIPNIWQEKGHSLTRAMMCILTAEDIARHLGLHIPPLFEVILPMTKRADEIIHIQKLYTRLSRFTCKLFDHVCTLSGLDVMPLFEGIDDMFGSRRLLERYIALHKKTYRKVPASLRLHIARSDPALNAGMVAAVVAGKVALSEFYRFGHDHGIAVHPAVGVGTLPFRGGLSPERIPEFLRQYGGMSTVYVQSAFRYDFPLPKVKAAIRKLNAELQATTPTLYAPEETRPARAVCDAFAKEYRRTVERLAPVITRLAMQVPRRRERKQHVGLFGYSRGIGRKTLPRAIPFTAVLYSLGVPPEFIGTGLGLKAAGGDVASIERFYPNFRSDMAEAGRFLNKPVLERLARTSPAWERIQDDVALTERLLGTEFGPRQDSDFTHRDISSRALAAWKAGKPLGDLIIEGGKVRKSLG